MSDKSGKRITAQLSHLAESAHVPIIAITQKQVPPQYSHFIEMLGSNSLVKSNQPFSIEVLNTEIMQMGERVMVGATHE
jgi:hypothetical protein